MTFKYYPTALEIRYRFFLDNLYENIYGYSSRHGFLDVTLCNQELMGWLQDKGFKTIDIRYEYGEIGGEKVFGFFGRTSGDGHCYVRIIWENEKTAMETYGDYRR